MFWAKRRYKGLGHWLASDERMQLGLLRRPSFDRIQVEQTLYEINESSSVVRLCKFVKYLAIEEQRSVKTCLARPREA